MGRLRRRGAKGHQWPEAEVVGLYTPGKGHRHLGDNVLLLEEVVRLLLHSACAQVKDTHLGPVEARAGVCGGLHAE